MPAFLYAKNKRGEIAQIVIQSHGSRGNVSIIEDYKDYIEADDYRILENYTDYGCIDDDINAISTHIGRLCDYILLVNKKFNIEQHKNDPEFKGFNRFAVGRGLTDAGVEKALANIKDYVAVQHRYVEASAGHKKMNRAIKWVGGLIVAAILALCACVVFCEYADDSSRYQKSGSRLIDTETNCVLTRSNNEWRWEPIQTSEE